MKRLIILLLLRIPCASLAGDKIFESGFETATTVTKLSQNFGEITGTDASTGYDWETDLLSSVIVRSLGEDEDVFGLSAHAGTGNIGVTDQVTLVADPEDAGNQVAKFENLTHRTDEASAMIGYVRYGTSSPNIYSESYIKYRMYLGPFATYLSTSWGSQIDWFIINEQYVWDDQNREEFRIHFSIHKQAGVGEDLYWACAGQQYTADVLGPEVWTASKQPGATYAPTNEVAVPLEEWFTLEIYHKKGNASNGRYVVWVTPNGGSRTRIFDITAVTEDPDYPAYLWRTHHIMKYYMDDTTINACINNSTPVTIYYDDFEYWDGLPEVVPPLITNPVPQNIVTCEP